MFAIKRTELITALRALQRDLCHYANPKRCDCKYYYDRKKHEGGEESGCPEVGLIAGLLEAMRDDEYNSLISRAHYIPISVIEEALQRG